MGHVDERSLAFLGDFFAGTVDNPILPGGMTVENIAENILGLHPDKGWFLIQHTHREREMNPVIGQGLEQMERPVTVGVFEWLGMDFLNKLFPIVAILDELFYGYQL